MLIWTNFDSFDITCLRSLVQKFHFAIDVCKYNKKGPRTGVQAAVFVEFFGIIFSFAI